MLYFHSSYTPPSPVPSLPPSLPPYLHDSLGQVHGVGKAQQNEPPPPSVPSCTPLEQIVNDLGRKGGGGRMVKEEYVDAFSLSLPSAEYTVPIGTT